MSDIIEIALDRFTDYSLFERLACEIMQAEGYPVIKPLGGTEDGGKDAQETPLYYAEGSKQRTIFQMSMEKDPSYKIQKTITRLEEKKEEYGGLVYVTTLKIGTAAQDRIKKKFREKYDVSIEIYSRNTLVIRLANYGNGIFHRFFPDIKSQLNDYFNALSQSNKAISKNQEEALLRIMLALNFSKEASAVQTAAFDNLVLATMIDSFPKDISADDILAKISVLFKSTELDKKQIIEAIERLGESGLAKPLNGKFRATEDAITSSISNEIRCKASLDEIVTDVIHILSSNSDMPITPVKIDMLRRNCRELLIDYFRMFGHELVNITSNDLKPRRVYAEAIPEIENKAKQQVSKPESQLLITSIADLLANPTAEQATHISSLSLSYLGTAILGLDPALRELTGERLKKKTFFLDTDIVIACLVEENPISKVYRSVVNRLIDAGAKVIIPYSCLQECIGHASYSHQTYNYFGKLLLSLPEITVPEQVWNGFVQGYYFGVNSGLLPKSMTYNKYLRNYFEPNDPYTFMEEVLNTVFDNNVVIQALEDMIPKTDIPEDLKKELEGLLFERLQLRAKKAEYRTEEQNWALAKTDTKLFLSIYYLNKNTGQKMQRILSASYYLITGSGRFIECSKKVGLEGKITARLQSVAGILQTLGRIKMSPHEFILLLENPFLAYAVQNIRTDIEGLLNAGLEMRGVGLTRLRRNLDEGLHGKITALDKVMEQPFREDVPSTLGDTEYLDLIEEATDKGYMLNPGAKALVQRVKKAKHDYEQRIEILDKYAEQVKTFGKRKQKYLKRFEKKARKD